MTCIATLNTGRNAVVKVEAIATFMKSFVADAYCLQEVDVNKASGPSWVSAWKSRGLYAFLGGGDDDEVFRTSVLASCPGYLIQLDVASSRYTAVVFEFQFEACIKKVVVVATFLTRRRPLLLWRPSFLVCRRSGWIGLLWAT